MNALFDPEKLTHSAIDAMEPGREMEAWIATMLLATSTPSYHAVDMTGFAFCSTDRAAAHRLTERMEERGWDHVHMAHQDWPRVGVLHDSRFIFMDTGVSIVGKVYCGEAYAEVICRSALHALLSQREARDR